MRLTLSLLALVLLVPAAAASSAHAQVIIQGEVTVSGGNQSYQGGQYQGNAQYQGGYAQPADPNAYQSSAYVQQPVGQPQPVRYVRRSSSIPALIVPGIILLAGGYVAQALGAPLLIDSWDNSDQLGFAYIPILGPWLQLGAFEDVDGAFESGIAHFSWVTGLAQALGLVLTIVGLTVREEWDEPVYALTDDPMGPALAFDGQRATLSF